MCPQVSKDDKKDLPKPGRHGQPCCLLCQIFGSPGYPSRLRFHDLVAHNVVAEETSLRDETLRPMVSLNRRRRTSEEKRLFLIETAPHFVGVQFKNDNAITGHLSHERHLHLLLAGLKMLFVWGGGASRGLGWTIQDWMGKATKDEEKKVESTRAWIDGVEVKLDMTEVRALCQYSK